MNECTCGQKFRDGEDYRDHLPCDGPEDALTERKLICQFLHWMQLAKHEEPIDYAYMIEHKEHHKTMNEIIAKYVEKSK